MTEKLDKTDQEWREELSPDRFHVLREKGTEPPFTGAYTYSHADGIYRCGACGNELFSSDAKFDSGTGWPSFTEPAVADAVELHEDRSLGMTRTEVDVRPLRQPPGPRLPGRPGPGRPALLHQLAVAGARRELLGAHLHLIHLRHGVRSPGTVRAGTASGAASRSTPEHEEDRRRRVDSDATPGQQLLDGDEPGDERHPRDAHHARARRARPSGPSSSPRTTRRVPRPSGARRPCRRATIRAGTPAGCGTCRGTRPSAA